MADLIPKGGRFSPDQYTLQEQQQRGHFQTLQVITSPAPPNTQNRRRLQENTSQSRETKNSLLSLPWKSKVKQMLLSWGSGHWRATTPT